MEFPVFLSQAHSDKNVHVDTIKAMEPSSGLNTESMQIKWNSKEFLSTKERLEERHLSAEQQFFEKYNPLNATVLLSFKPHFHSCQKFKKNGAMILLSAML